jgi:hypothetical protein
MNNPNHQQKWMSEIDYCPACNRDMTEYKATGLVVLSSFNDTPGYFQICEPCGNSLRDCEPSERIHILMRIELALLGRDSRLH